MVYKSFYKLALSKYGPCILRHVIRYGINKELIQLKRKWIKRLAVLIIIVLVILIGIGLLFRDDGSTSGFTSPEAEAEFKDVYQVAMEQLPEPEINEKLETSFGQVQIYGFGDVNSTYPPLVLLPGTSASTPMWESNLEDFISDRFVYTIDLIGEPGLSVETNRVETHQDQAVWLDEVLQQIPDEKVHLLGYSFGGWNAANLALHHSNKLESLILVDPVYAFDSIPLKMVLASIPASVPFIPTSIRDEMLSYIAGGAEIDEDDPVSQLIETGMRTFNRKVPMPSLIEGKQLQSISIPVLGIIAGQSTMLHADDAMSYGEEHLIHPASEMLLFEQASHAINGEYPEELANNILQFIEKIEGDDGSD